MRVRFNNVAMAAAFLGGVMAQASRDNSRFILEDYPDIGDLPMQGPVLEVTTNKVDDVTFIDISDDSGDPNSPIDFRIPTTADLNYIVNRIIPPNTVAASKRGTSVHGHEVTIHRDGSLSVGCKSFSKDDVTRVVRAAKRVKSGLSFTEFTTSTRHRVRPGAVSIIAIDSDGVVTAEEVEHITKERDEFLASPQQASIPAFNLLA